MKTFKEFMLEFNQHNHNKLLKSWLKRDQSKKEMNSRENLQKDVLAHYSDDAVGNKRLEHAARTNPVAIHNLAQHMEHNPEFQKRVVSGLRKRGDKEGHARANFLQDRMDVNDELRKSHPPELYKDIRDTKKRWDHKTKSYVDRDKNDNSYQPDKGWKPPTSPEEAHKRISDPKHPEYNPHVAAAVNAVKKKRPEGYRISQPSFKVNSDEWFPKGKLEESAWRSIKAPQQAREFSREFDPNYQINKADPKSSRAGEMTAQLAGDKQEPFMHPAIRKAMRNLAKQPKMVKKQIGKTEKYGKGTIKKRDVQNTTGAGDWEQEKGGLTPERVARAEKSRSRVQTSPTILRVKDPLSGKNIEHNVGGNTRLTSMRRFGTADVHIIKGFVNPNRRSK